MEELHVKACLSRQAVLAFGTIMYKIIVGNVPDKLKEKV